MRYTESSRRLSHLIVVCNRCILRGYINTKMPFSSYVSFDTIALMKEILTVCSHYSSSLSDRISEVQQ